MKLKQKFVMLLAAAMITSSIPMVTFAKNTSISKTLILTEDDTVGYTVDDDDNIEIKKPFEQFLTFDIDIDIKEPESIEVYLEGDNIEITQDLFNAWAKDNPIRESDGKDIVRFTMNNYGNETTPGDGTEGTIEIEYTDDNELKVILKGGSKATDQFRMPLLYQAKDGLLKLNVASHDGRIEEGTYTLSKGEVSNKKFTAEIDDAGKIISVEGEGELGEIEIDEIKANTLNGSVFRLTIDSSDLIFSDKYNDPESGILDDSNYGLSSAVSDDDVTFVRSDEDNAIGYLIFDFDTSKVSAPGGVVIKNIEVEAEDDEVATGDIDLTIELMEFFDDPDDGLTRDDFDAISNGRKPSDNEDYTWDDVDTEDASDDMEEVEGVIAVVREAGVGLSVEEEVDTIGGKYTHGKDDNKVEIKFSDPTKEFLTDNGKLELTLEGAIFAPVPASEIIKSQTAGDDFADEDGFYTEITSDDDRIEYDDDALEDFILINENHPNVAEFNLQDLDDQDELVIQFYVVGNPGFNGDIELTAEGSKWDDPMTATIGTVTQPIEVNLVQPIDVVENERAYPAGLITISETDEHMFEADDVIAIKIEDLLIDDADVVADNGLDIDTKIAEGHLLIEIQGRSKDPATITISDIKLDGSGYIPVGEYTAYIGGQGIHVANTPINFEESSSSKIVGKPDEADDWDDDWEDYKNNEINLEDYSEDKDEIFAAAFSLGSFVTSYRPVEPEPEPVPPIIIPPTPDPIPQPDDVKGENGNYGLPDLDIRISNGRATVNGKYAEVTSEPLIVDGVTMVGVADLAKLLGIPRDKEVGNTLNYYQHGNDPAVVTLRLDKRRTLEIIIGSYEINIYDYNSLTGTYQSVGKKSLIKPAQILMDNEGLSRTFVPMRPIGEALGFEVSWDSKKSEAIFTNKN